MEIVSVGAGKEFGEVEVDVVFDYDEEFVKNYMKEHNTTFEAALMAYQGTTKENGRDFAELQDVIGHAALAVLDEMEKTGKRTVSISAGVFFHFPLDMSRKLCYNTCKWKKKP